MLRYKIKDFIKKKLIGKAVPRFPFHFALNPCYSHMLYVFVHAGTCLPNGIMNLTGATHKRIDLTIIEHFYCMLLLHNTDSNHKHQNDA